MAEQLNIDQLKRRGIALVNRRKRQIALLKRMRKLYAMKARIEHTNKAYDQLGQVVYHLHSARYMLRLLLRAQRKLARLSPTIPAQCPGTAAQLPM